MILIPSTHTELIKQHASILGLKAILEERKTRIFPDFDKSVSQRLGYVPPITLFINNFVLPAPENGNIVFQLSNAYLLSYALKGGSPVHE